MTVVVIISISEANSSLPFVVDLIFSLSLYSPSAFLSSFIKSYQDYDVRLNENRQVVNFLIRSFHRSERCKEL